MGRKFQHIIRLGEGYMKSLIADDVIRQHVSGLVLTLTHRVRTRLNHVWSLGWKCSCTTDAVAARVMPKHLDKQSKGRMHAAGMCAGLLHLAIVVLSNLGRHGPWLDVFTHQIHGVFAPVFGLQLDARKKRKL